MHACSAPGLVILHAGSIFIAVVTSITCNNTHYILQERDQNEIPGICIVSGVLMMTTQYLDQSLMKMA